MNRKHNFKAWDKKSKSWVFDGAVMNLEYSGSHGDFLFDNDSHSMLSSLDLIWVESTGLKDNNGVEIFEGDILYHKFWFSMQFSYKYIENEEHILVEIPEFFKWLGSEEIINSNKPTEEFVSNMEIIGNKFESPELLEKVS